MVGRYCLSECLLYGRGVPTDETRAVDLLKQAAIGGEPRAMDLLGTCYAHGRGGLSKDFGEAFRLYTQAAGLHYWDSLANLGVPGHQRGDSAERPCKSRGKSCRAFSGRHQKWQSGMHFLLCAVPGVRGGSFRGSNGSRVPLQARGGIRLQAGRTMVRETQYSRSEAGGRRREGGLTLDASASAGIYNVLAGVQAAQYGVALPMKPFEIFAQFTPAQAEPIFCYLLKEDKDLYKASIESLAKQRNLRAVFVTRKTPAERHAWMHDVLSRKASSPICAHLLQTWLVGAHSALLCDFLDSLRIAHDEKGTLETLPPAPEKEALREAVEKLLAKYDRLLVAIYLQSFQALDDTGWTSLDELLEEDDRLKIVRRA